MNKTIRSHTGFKLILKKNILMKKVIKSKKNLGKKNLGKKNLGKKNLGIMKHLAIFYLVKHLIKCIKLLSVPYCDIMYHIPSVDTIGCDSN